MTRFGMAGKTAAYRAEINARAAKQPRPLSPTQLEALETLAGGRMEYSIAGFTGFVGGKRTRGRLRYFSSQTMMALEKRGLCKIEGAFMKHVATITRGRRERRRSSLRA